MIHIITDSTCDLSKDEIKKLNIEVIPLSVYFGDIEYKDGVDISKEEFYEKLESCETLPKTSAINPYEFKQVFEKFTKDEDQILCILVSQELSGTYQSAIIALDEFSEKEIQVIDSRSASIGMAFLIKEAVRLREEGKELNYITKHLNQIKDRVKVVGIIDTLKYLKMGGRLTSTSAFLGEILGIQPIISIYNGKIEPLDKCRNLKSGLRKVLEYIEEYPIDYSFGVSYGHTNTEKKIQTMIDYMEPNLVTQNISISKIGLAVGTHAGPGLVAIAYVEAKKR